MQRESTVYLRGIDLLTLAEDYINNRFEELRIPLPVDTSSLSESPSSIVTVRDKLEQSPYEFDLGMNRKFGCVGYKIHDTSGQYGKLDPNKEYNCMLCLRPVKGSNAISIPIARMVIGDDVCYHGIDIFCTWECMYGELLTRLDNKLYTNSVVLAIEAFTRATGKDHSELKRPTDKRFLEIFNGPMSWEEYHSKTNRYSRKSGNIIFFPAIEYIEQDP